MLWHQRDKGQNIFGIERFVLIGISASLMAMPTMFIRWVSGRHGYLGRKLAIEMWALVKPGIFFWILISGHWSAWWAVWVAVYGLADLFLYLFGLVLLRGFWVAPPSYSRSLILIGINLFEIAAGFSILYLHYGFLRTAPDTIVVDWPSAYYFSIVTAATIGYGDISPSPAGRGLVTIHIALAIAYMAIIISRFVANLDNKRTPIEHA